MATKKTDKTDVNQMKDIVTEEIDAEMINKAPESVESAWDRNMKVIVPRKPKGEDQNYYICINDRRFLLPANGKEQELPEPVAKVLLESLEAENEADDFMDQIPNRAGETPQEHPI